MEVGGVAFSQDWLSGSRGESIQSRLAEYEYGREY